MYKPVAVFGPVTETKETNGYVREGPEHCSFWPSLSFLSPEYMTAFKISASTKTVMEKCQQDVVQTAHFCSFLISELPTPDNPARQGRHCSRPVCLLVSPLRQVTGWWTIRHLCPYFKAMSPRLEDEGKTRSQC